MDSSARDLVFVSYSHKDALWLERLKTHLKPFERRGAISVWDDQRIRTGARWRDEISQALARARVAVLLVSPDFLASEFIAKHELPKLLSTENELTVVWLPVRPSNYAATEVGDYQAAFDPKRTLAEMDDAEADRALVAAAEKIEQAFRAGPSVGSPPGRVAAGGKKKAAVALGVAVALAAAAWLMQRRPPAGVTPAPSEAARLSPPPAQPTGAAVHVEGNLEQPVGPGANGVIGNQINIGERK